MDKERGFFMHRDFYIRLINREHPLPETFVPEHLIDIGLPFEAAPGDPKRLLEWNVRPREPPPSFFTPATDVA